MNLISPTAFLWVLSVVTFGGAGWALYDVIRLWKLRGADRRDPLVGDKRFGWAIGIAIGVIAIVGTLHANGVV